MPINKGGVVATVNGIMILVRVMYDSGCYVGRIDPDHYSEFDLICDASKINQVRLSVSSIPFSMRLAVAMSPCSSQAVWT
jgi:hypothetical protein